MAKKVISINKTTADDPPYRKAALYVWAVLLARIYEVLPLVCPQCGSEMKIIAFINEPLVIREILAYLGEPTAPPSLNLARGPPCGSCRTSVTLSRNRHRTSN